MKKIVFAIVLMFAMTISVNAKDLNIFLYIPKKSENIGFRSKRILVIILIK